MSDILNSMRLDFYIIRANFKMLIAPAYILAIVLGVLTQATYMIVLIVMFISAISSGMFFSVYEKNNLSKLYGFLPLGKSEVVMGRYLYALLFGIINEIVSLTLTYIVSQILNKGIGQLEFSACISGSFLFFCLSVGIQFPIYFKFGFSKAYIFTNLPLYLIFISIFIIIRTSRKTNILSSLGQVIQYFTSNPAMVWVTGIGLGIILFYLSFLLSSVIYKKSEL